MAVALVSTTIYNDCSGLCRGVKNMRFSQFGNFGFVGVLFCWTVVCATLPVASVDARSEKKNKVSSKKPLPRMVPIVMPAAKPAPSQKALPSITFEKLESGSRSGIVSFDTVLVNQKSVWERLLTRHRVKGVEKTSPIVDFEKETVLGVFAGQKPSAGYSVEILQIYRTTLGAKVVYKINSPPPGTKAAEAMTQPYELVKIPKLRGPVEFFVDKSSH